MQVPWRACGSVHAKILQPLAHPLAKSTADCPRWSARVVPSRLRPRRALRPTTLHAHLPWVRLTSGTVGRGCGAAARLFAQGGANTSRMLGMHSCRASVLGVCAEATPLAVHLTLLEERGRGRCVPAGCSALRLAAPTLRHYNRWCFTHHISARCGDHVSVHR